MEHLVKEEKLVKFEFTIDLPTYKKGEVIEATPETAKDFEERGFGKLKK
jgi:hypothetical protein